MDIRNILFSNRSFTPIPIALTLIYFSQPKTPHLYLGLCFIIIGLVFGGWTIQMYSEEQILPPGLALIGIGGVILGTILLITATILYSIVNVIREKR